MGAGNPPGQTRPPSVREKEYALPKWERNTHFRNGRGKRRRRSVPRGTWNATRNNQATSHPILNRNSVTNSGPKTSAMFRNMAF
jgi:hypothetical protein